MSRRFSVPRLAGGIAVLTLIGMLSLGVSVAPAFAQGTDPATVQQSPSPGTIVLGSTETDSATVTGSVNGTPPSGSVAFYICYPSSSGAAPCTANSDDQEIKVADLDGTDNPSEVDGASWTPAEAGTWCFGAVYSGDGNYAQTTDESTDGCFTVTQGTSSTSSALADSSIVLGSSNTDTASVSSSGFAPPTGSVTFYECGPTTTTDEPCSSGYTQLDTEPISTVVGNTQTATSNPFTPTATGVWCFEAVYSGDGNYTGSSDQTDDGCFNVTTATSSTTSAPSGAIVLGNTETDSATVTGSVSGVDPTGSVTFYECAPGTSPCNSTSGTLVDSVGLSGGSNPDTVTSSSFLPTSAGSWSFAADYSGDTNYASSSDGSSDESFTVSAATPSITSAPTSPVIATGTSDTDQVTVTGNSAGGSPTGTLTFYECYDPSAPAPCTSTNFRVGNATYPLTAGTNDTSTVTAPPKATVAAGNTGYVCFDVDYSGSSNYIAGVDTSTTECFQVVNPPSITGFTPAKGYAGQTVTIRGSYLAHATLVEIGSTRETVTKDTASEIIIKIKSTTPLGGAEISVTVSDGLSSSSSSNFKVIKKPKG
jgi:hypothetical protein